MTTQEPLAQVETLLGAGEPVVVIDSPPGAGKTQLAVELAVRASLRGSRVAVLAPGAAQAFGAARRILAWDGRTAVRLLVGRNRPLPADLLDHPRLGGGISDGAPVEVFTVRKFVLSVPDMAVPEHDLAVVDEAYLAMAGDLEAILPFARQVVLIGDPGQLPPLLRGDARRLAVARYRVLQPMPLEVLRLRPATPVVRLPHTHRLPQDTVDLIGDLFYPGHPFGSLIDGRLTVRDSSRRRDPVGRAVALLADGASLAAILQHGPTPVGPVDLGLARTMARTTVRLLEVGVAPDGAPLRPEEIGIIDPHVAMESAIRRELGRLGVGEGIRIGTPETWQGDEALATVCRHPVQARADEFSLDPGRWCVALTRHRLASVVVARADVREALDAPAAPGTRRLGQPDRAWQGRTIHRELLRRLDSLGRVIG